MANDKKLERAGVPTMDASRSVTLGEQTYVVVPQKIGYLRSKLGVALGSLDQLGLDSENVIESLGNRAHDVLNVFIPDLMPNYEFQGFATQEAMDKGEYDERYDKSPSPPQIRAAFMAAAEVNEIDLLKHLGKLIGPEIIRGYIAGVMADSLETRRQTSDSPSSSSPSGDTESMTSGTTPSTENGLSASPSLAS